MNERREDNVVRAAAKGRTAAEAARSEAEQCRRLAEEGRAVRDHRREALETVRQARERLRETAETAWQPKWRAPRARKHASPPTPRVTPWSMQYARQPIR